MTIHGWYSELGNSINPHKYTPTEIYGLMGLPYYVWPKLMKKLTTILKIVMRTAVLVIKGWELAKIYAKIQSFAYISWFFHQQVWPKKLKLIIVISYDTKKFIQSYKAQLKFHFCIFCLFSYLPDLPPWRTRSICINRWFFVSHMSLTP